MATVRLINKLKEKFPTEMPLLVLQLHDELIFEVNQGQLSEVEKIIKEVLPMEDVFSVKFAVKVKHGNCWSALND